MDRSRVMKDSCGEYGKRLRRYLSEYVGQRRLLVVRYKDVYERT